MLSVDKLCRKAVGFAVIEQRLGQETNNWEFIHNKTFNYSLDNLFLNTFPF